MRLHAVCTGIREKDSSNKKKTSESHRPSNRSLLLVRYVLYDVHNLEPTPNGILSFHHLGSIISYGDCVLRCREFCLEMVPRETMYHYKHDVGWVFPVRIAYADCKGLDSELQGQYIASYSNFG